MKSFFDTKLMGDLMQRMSDHGRVNNFLTGQALSITFAILTFTVFSVVLFIYNKVVFLIFLDEATNSLDASNERSIVENLDKFYKGRTVVVAHRLSTVKNADQIVALGNGKVVETGNGTLQLKLHFIREVI